MKKKFITYLFKNKSFIIMLALLVVFANMFAQLVPYFQGLIVDNTLITQDMRELILLCLVIFSVLFLDAVCRLFFNSFMLNFGYKTAKNIQAQTFKQILDKPYDFFEEKSRGDILYRTNTYIYDVGNFISKDVADLAISIARILMIFVFLFVLESYFAVIMFFLYAFILIIMSIYSNVIIKRAKATRDKELHRNAVILQNIDGLETFLAFNTSGKYLNNYIKVSSNYSTVRNKYYKTLHLFLPLIDFLVCLGTVLVYIIASTHTIHLVQIGVVVAILSYSASMISPMESMTKGIASFADTSAIVDEVLEYANEEFEHFNKNEKNNKEKSSKKFKNNKKNLRKINKKSKNIEKTEKNQILNGKNKNSNFKNKIMQLLRIRKKNNEQLNYAPLCCDINAIENNSGVGLVCENLTYVNNKNNTNIKNLNLTINAKEKVLLLGKSGSGKTVFAGLLCGLYKPNSGKIMFNNVEIQGLSNKNLADLISMTSDIVSIFKASVFENVKFAKPNATEKEILKAIKFSGLNKIVNTLAHGVNTIVDPNYMSEGDKQLISFARIILKNTPIIIVDEVSRDMGTSVKKKFLRNLSKFTKNKTLIYISEEDDVDFEFNKKIEFNKIKE